MLPGKQNRKNLSNSTKDSAAHQAEAKTSRSSSLPAGLLRQSLSTPGDSSPQALQFLQQHVGNRAVNRLLASQSNPAPVQPAITPLPSISRVSRMVIQREISEETFSQRATTYGFRNLSPQLVTGLVSIVNTIIRKYPAHENLILENLDDVLLHIEPTWPVQSHVRSFVSALGDILTDKGDLEVFVAPPEVWDIGRVQQPPPPPQHDEDEDTDNSVDSEDDLVVPEIEGEIDPEDVAAEQGLPQELGQAHNGVIPVNERHTIKLTMGQGLVANLGQLILYSDEFSSCSPVVMYNQNTHMGGLFHFPAGSLEAQRGNLTSMYNRVNPTHVFVNDRGRLDGGMGPQSMDHFHLEDFFTNDLGFQWPVDQIPLRSNQYALTQAEDGNNIIIDNDVHSVGGVLDVYRDRTGGGRREVAQKLQHAPSATKFGRDDWHTN